MSPPWKPGSIFDETTTRCERNVAVYVEVSRALITPVLGHPFNVASLDWLSSSLGRASLPVATLYKGPDGCFIHTPHIYGATPFVRRSSITMSRFEETGKTTSDTISSVPSNDIEKTYDTKDVVGISTEAVYEIDRAAERRSVVCLQHDLVH